MGLEIIDIEDPVRDFLIDYTEPVRQVSTDNMCLLVGWGLNKGEILCISSNSSELLK